MGRPKRAPNAVSTEERILAAAEAHFAKHGFEAARLEDIADAAGVRRPSLLYHFASKEALYAETVHRVFAGLRDALVEAMSGTGSFEERLDRTVDGYVGFLLAHPDLARIFLREVLHGRGPGRALVEQEVAPLFDLVERFLRGAGPARRERLDARAAILLVVGGAVLYAVAGNLRGALYPKQSDSAFIAASESLARAMVLARPGPAKNPHPTQRKHR